MAKVIGRRGARASPSDRRNGDTPANSNDDPGRRRRLFFQAGDVGFLVCVGIAATVTMHMFHEFRWPFVLTWLLGMVAAMAVQVLLVVMAVPLLGSIEIMVPSMIVAMVGPMTICTLHLTGQEPTRFIAIAIGSVVAMSMFVFVQCYGRACADVLQKENVDAPN